PDNFINAEGNGITDDFRYYLRPLLGSGYPVPHRLRAPLVNKLLSK
ncbi:MAG: 6-phosphofructokinase, partial [Candidatus Cloacimonetes bacterium]|nr:6-phosphofructokinase [Candidatus Cloacimonadota bacterium]